MATLQRFIACVLLCYQVIGTQCCGYAFANLHNYTHVDWSISIGTVVFKVVVNDLLTNSIAHDVELTMESRPESFQLGQSDTHQAVVKECLRYGTQYTLKFFINSEGSCYPAFLYVYAMSATTLYEMHIITNSVVMSHVELKELTPVYNMASTDFFTTVYTDVPEFYTYAFAVKISNDQIYGGCGSFKCSAKNLNGGKVQLKYDRASGVFLAFGSVYNVEVRCLDSSDSGYITEDHFIVVKLTFWQTTSTTTSTTITTQPTSLTTSTTTLTTTTPTTTTTTTTTSTTITTKPTSTSLPSTSTFLTPAFITAPTKTLFHTQLYSVSLYPKQHISTSPPSGATTSRLASLTTSANAPSPPQPTTTSLHSTSKHGFFSDWRYMVSVIIPVAVLMSGCLLGICKLIHRRMKRKQNIQPLPAT